MKKSILFLLILCIPMTTFAVSAYNGAIKFKQNDGSTFSGKLKGDEWFHWVEDKSGHVIKYNRQSKNYEYGIIKEINGTLDLLPSGIRVGDETKQANSSAPALQKINKKALSKIWKQKRNKALHHQ